MAYDARPRYDYQKVGRVRDYLATVDAETLADALGVHYANHADQNALARRATLAKLLPQLNDRLEDEVQGLLDFQKSIQNEDKENAQARARARSFNAEQRRKEQAALLFNLEFLKFQAIGENLDEATLQRYQKINDEFIPQLEQALTRHQQTGKLSKDHAEPKVAVPPRRNHRREEIARRTALIKRLSEFCELVESVVAGRRIVDEDALSALLKLAYAYLDGNEELNAESVASNAASDELYEYKFVPWQEGESVADYMARRPQEYAKVRASPGYKARMRVRQAEERARARAKGQSP